MGSLRSLITNLATLALSLLIALIIWSVAIRENDPLDLRLLQLPVQIVGLPADSQIPNAPETVEIRVEAPTSVLSTLSTNQFIAEMDVTDLPAGDHTVDINVRHDVSNLTVDFQAPEQADVTIERIVTRQIPVEVDVRGEVARGYQLGEPFADPETISVTGISSRVESLSEARIEIFLDSPREDVVRTRTPVFYNRQGEIAGVAGLSLSTRDVQVTVPVDELAGFSVKPIIVDWTGEPATGYRVLSVSAQPDNALVTGSPTQIDQVSFLRTETIDITGLRESTTVPATLDLPVGLTLEDIQSVIVSIEVEPIITTDVVRRAPEIRNLAEGLTATLSVDEVAVFLAGPFDKLELLTEDDVRVTVDLFGLITGTHRVPVEAAVLASDIEVRSLQPSEITAVISRVVTITEQLTETLTLPGILLTQGATQPAHSDSVSSTPYGASAQPVAAAPFAWRRRAFI